MILEPCAEPHRLDIDMIALLDIVVEVRRAEIVAAVGRGLETLYIVPVAPVFLLAVEVEVSAEFVVSSILDSEVC